ncbi:hypothetical protein ALC53_11169, partial [Atta colombica]
PFAGHICVTRRHSAGECDSDSLPGGITLSLNTLMTLIFSHPFAKENILMDIHEYICKFCENCFQKHHISPEKRRADCNLNEACKCDRGTGVFCDRFSISCGMRNGKKRMGGREVVGIVEQTQKCIADPSLTPNGDDGGPLVRVICRLVCCLPVFHSAQYFPGDAVANIISAWASKEDKVLTPVCSMAGWINCRACLNVQTATAGRDGRNKPRVICRFCV